MTKVADFVNGIKIIFGHSESDGNVGDKKLARLSLIVMGQIGVYGTDAVRTQVIKSIEGDLKRATKKGPEVVEKLIQNAVATPDYMKLLHKLGLEEPHIRVMAKQAQKRLGKKGGD